MTDPQQIPHLVKLLDDDDLEIQTQISRELIAFGPLLKREINKLTFSLNPTQKDKVNPLEKCLFVIGDRGLGDTT